MTSRARRRRLTSSTPGVRRARVPTFSSATARSCTASDVIAVMPGARLIDAPLVAPLVAELGELRAAMDGATPLNALRPVYVRRPDVELARRRAAAPRVG